MWVSCFSPRNTSPQKKKTTQAICPQLRVLGQKTTFILCVCKPIGFDFVKSYQMLLSAGQQPPPQQMHETGTIVLS